MATPITKEFLEGLGFREIPGVLPSYDINISRHPEHEHKVLSCTIEKGNQYVYVREGVLEKPRHEDNLVLLFNSDYDGALTCEYIETLYDLLKQKLKF